jgi:hypothetical protein
VDCRSLPEPDGTVDVLILDLGYVAKGGRKTSGIEAMDDRYGIGHEWDPRTPKELQELIEAGIKEGARVLKRKGRIMVKCMDYVSGGKTIWGRRHVEDCLIAAGAPPEDTFLLVRPSGGPQPLKNLDGSKRVQTHTHKAHSYLVIGVKK